MLRFNWNNGPAIVAFGWHWLWNIPTKCQCFGKNSDTTKRWFYEPINGWRKLS